MSKQKIEKWRNWTGGDEKSLLDEMISLCHHRDIFMGLKKMHDANSSIPIPSEFYPFIAQTYSDSLFMGVRRLLKPHKDSISLLELLKDFKKNHELLSKEMYFKIDNGTTAESKNLSALNIFGNKKHLIKDEISKDVSKIEKYEFIIHYADDKIAHIGKKDLKKPSIQDAHAALDAIEEVLKRYIVVLTGKGYESFTPVIQYN